MQLLVGKSIYSLVLKSFLKALSFCFQKAVQNVGLASTELFHSMLSPFLVHRNLPLLLSGDTVSSFSLHNEETRITQ